MRNVQALWSTTTRTRVSTVRSAEKKKVAGSKEGRKERGGVGALSSIQCFGGDVEHSGVKIEEWEECEEECKEEHEQRKEECEEREEEREEREEEREEREEEREEREEEREEREEEREEREEEREECEEEREEEREERKVAAQYMRRGVRNVE